VRRASTARTAVLAVLAASSTVLAIGAGAPQRARGPANRTTTAATCVADLGTGQKSGRQFCDVILATAAASSIAMTIPAHRGTAELSFDLHNRFAVPPESMDVVHAFARQVAVVSVIGPKGEIGRAVAVGEFRTATDLFDRISGGAGPGGVKAVGPGPATPIKITIPAGVSSIGIVGVRLDVTTRLGNQRYDTPGRPVAIASDLKIDYTPLR
jgi:hypothetical protein